MSPKRANAEYKIRGRLAHAGRSAKTSRFYDSEIEPIFETTEGNMPIGEFREKYNNSDSKTQFSMTKLKPVGSSFSRKSCTCGGKIIIGPDEKAVCDCCNTIFNDGGNIDGLLVITRKYSDGRPDEVTLPSKREREVLYEDHPELTKHFMKRISH